MIALWLSLYYHKGKKMIKCETSEGQNLKRSKRLQKKLLVGEFQQFAFVFNFKITSPLNCVDPLAFLETTMVDLINKNPDIEYSYSSTMTPTADPTINSQPYFLINGYFSTNSKIKNYQIVRCFKDATQPIFDINIYEKKCLTWDCCWESLSEKGFIGNLLFSRP